MKLSHTHLICDWCRKQKGRAFDHSKCSQMLQQNGPLKETKHHKSSVKQMERNLEYYLEDRGETPPYLETALDYRTLERLKNGG
jgi:hypothetical protein